MAAFEPIPGVELQPGTDGRGGAVVSLSITDRRAFLLWAVNKSGAVKRARAAGVTKAGIEQAISDALKDW